MIQRKHIVIVGTGVAALEAAHTAARSGHEVTVLGDWENAGGKTRLHAQLPGGENLSSVYDYQFLMAKRNGVKFSLGRAAEASDIMRLSPDLVLLATGARTSQPAWLNDEWAESGLIPSLREIAIEMLDRNEATDGRIVLVDQDHTEMTYAVAELLSTKFSDVSIITQRERIAHDVSLINRQGIYQRLHRLGVEIHCNVEAINLDDLEDGEFAIRNVYSGQVDTLSGVVALTHASSRVPNDQLLEPLRAQGCQVLMIGDANAPRSLLATTREAYQIACSL